MTTIQWRPAVNALTTPQSYRPRHVPRAILRNDDLAHRVAARNPVYNEGLVKGVLSAIREEIRDELINGNQITLEGLFTCHLTFTARMDAPDDPLPPLEESLQVRAYASKRLVEEVRRAAQTERLPMSEKLPLITSAQDTVLALNDVLNPEGLLRLSGDDLLFDQHEEGCGCLLEGTRAGRTTQSRFGMISNSEIIVMPDIPSQPDPWNNEYRLSVSTQYTEHGSLRTGIYRRMLRAPLAVSGFGNPKMEVGILSGDGESPLVTVTGGTLTGNTWVRIQALLDVRDGDLHLNLLDMTDTGSVGDAVRVSGDGACTLPGFVDSALSGLEVKVNKYADLVKLVRSPYTGRLIDVLDVSA